MTKLIRNISIIVIIIFGGAASYVVINQILAKQILYPAIFLLIIGLFFLMDFFDTLVKELLKRDYYQSFFINKEAKIDNFEKYTYDVYINTIKNQKLSVGNIVQKIKENGDNSLKLFLTINNSENNNEILLKQYFIGEFKKLDEVKTVLRKIAKNSIGLISYEDKKLQYQLIQTINGWKIIDNIKVNKEHTVFVFDNYNNALKKFKEIQLTHQKCIRVDFLQKYLNSHFKQVEIISDNINQNKNTTNKLNKNNLINEENDFKEWMIRSGYEKVLKSENNSEIDLFKNDYYNSRGVFKQIYHPLNK